MPAQLEIYEEIRAVSGRMVESAQANDWDRLVELERRMTELRGVLETAAESAPLSAVENERKRSLIQQILADDAEVRRHAEPWMAQVRQLLGSQHQRRQVQRAYVAAGEAADG
jgi:flagellar protein FliT